MEVSRRCPKQSVLNHTRDNTGRLPDFRRNAFHFGARPIDPKLFQTHANHCAHYVGQSESARYRTSFL